MKALVVVLALVFSVPSYEPMISSGQCDATVYSCMPVITRTRALMVAV